MPKVRIPKIVRLAEQVESDIRSRGLQAGDPYMNAAELARELRVSASTANRVLQILDERGVVERARKKGTLVSNPSPEGPLRTIKRVHMLTFQASARPVGVMTDPVIVGIQHKLPGSMIQFNFLSSVVDAEQVRRLLDEARRSPDPVGIVLTRAPFAAQKMVEDSGVPTVVHGYLQPSVSRLAWITIDYGEIGRLLGACVRERNARRVAVVIPEQPLLPGDYHLLDRLGSELGQGKYRPGDLQVGCLPRDDDAVAAWFGAHVALGDGRTVVACYRDYHVPGVRKALRKAGVKRDACDIVVIDEHWSGGRKSGGDVARIVSPVSEFDVGVDIAELLIDQLKRKRGKGKHRVFPVELVA